MERPNHLHIEEKSAASRASSVAIVAAIHVFAILGLVAALNQGAIMEQLADIKEQIKHFEYGVRIDFDLPPNMSLDPNNLVKVLDRQVKALRQSQANVELELDMFQDKPSAKAWLRMEMERLEIEAMTGNWFD